jgi:hypothetical protein
MLSSLPFVGAIHGVLALSGIVVGLIQLLRPKRGAGHRARGYAFVYAMLIADGAAMLIFQFTGRLNILHFGAMANMTCIVLGIVPLLRSPRPANWKLQHYYFISWSYVGLLSAAATQLMQRTMHLTSQAQAWMVIAVASIVVTAIGFVLIARYRPRSESRSVPGNAIQHDGAPS